MDIDVWGPSVPVEQNYHNWSGEPCLIEPSNGELSECDYLMVDLFCGCGGFSIGFEAAGFDVFLGLDIHGPSVKTFMQNHPHSYGVLGDIRKMDNDTIRGLFGERHISIVTAGVPCQGFSLCNRKRTDEDERNFLFLEFLRFVELLEPEFVLLENVSGLKSAANGEFRKQISDRISQHGYEVDVMTLNAAEYGVPQQRNRVFFQGVKPDFEIRWPTPSHGGQREPFVTVWEAIGDLPEIEAGDSATEYIESELTDYQRAMRAGCDIIYNHEAPSHPQNTIDRIANTKPGEPMYPRFKQRIRLAPNDVSPTQVSGGIRPSFQLGHPTQARGLTVRERCRIQSIPDRYEVLGGIVQGRVQTGNAVPPLLAQAIARQMIGVLRSESPTKKTLRPRPTQMELIPLALVIEG